MSVRRGTVDFKGFVPPNLRRAIGEKTGLIWYKTLCDRLKPLASFEDAVRLTVAVAKEAFGTAESRAVKEGWKAVGL